MNKVIEFLSENPVQYLTETMAQVGACFPFGNNGDTIKVQDEQLIPS